MSDTSHGEGWWLASDGRWYPPTPPLPQQAEQLPQVAPGQANGSGWWLASDGAWYPPPAPYKATQPAASPDSAKPSTLRKLLIIGGALTGSFFLLILVLGAAGALLGLSEENGAAERPTKTTAAEAMTTSSAVATTTAPTTTTSPPTTAAPKPERSALQRIGPGAAAISRAYLGEDWPLTVEEGGLRCWTPTGSSAKAVTFSTGPETVYAVNGRAKTLAKQLGVDWLPIDPIWLPDPVIPGARKDIGPLLDVGLGLCD